MGANEKTSSSSLSIKQKHIFFFILFGLGVYFAFHILTHTHNWGGDFAHYLHHTENLCYRKPYAQTHFIPNQNLFFGPPAYPPLLPLLLTPFYCLYGNQNLIPYKIFLVTIFLLASLFFALWVRKHYSYSLSLLTLTILLFNPYIHKEIYNQIISDGLFFSLSILIGISSYKKESLLWGKMDLFSWILFSFFILISILTRSVGLLFLFSLILHTLIHHFDSWKRISFILLICLSIFFIQWFVQYWVFHISNHSYWETFFQLNLSQMITNIRWYFYLFRTQFGIWGVAERLNFILGILLVLSITIGFCRKILKKITFMDCFVFLYTIGVLILWPIPAGFRFLLPILPWLFLYLKYLMDESHLLQRSQNYLFNILALIMVVNFLIQYPTIKKSALSEAGPYTSEAKEIFHYIQNNTPFTARITFSKPRVLSFFTKRTSIVWQCDSFSSFLRFIDTYKIHYILLCNDIERDNNCLQSIISTGEGKYWKLIYYNPRFQLYQINLRD